MTTDKVKIGIVGTGQRICHHGGCVFRNCKDEIRLAGLCDTDADRLGHARETYEKEFGYKIATYEDYLGMYAKGGLDAVYIAGPNYLHKDMAVAAFEHGLHVLCEKPLAVTLEECEQIRAAAKKADRLLGAAMQMHYRQRYHKVRQLIAEGAIGIPAMFWCTEYRGPFAGMKDWVCQRRKSGGAIVEKNCHHYDILNLWADSEPTTVYASGNVMKHDMLGGRKSEIIDNAWVVNDYASGARAMLGICFLGEEKHRREFGVQGTEGKIFFSLADQEVLHVELNSGANAEYAINEDLRGGVFKDFVDCIRSGTQPLVTGEMARKSLLVPLAAEKSIREERIVSVSEIT